MGIYSQQAGTGDRDESPAPRPRLSRAGTPLSIGDLALMPPDLELPDSEVASLVLHLIRTETALSRYPLHQLSKSPEQSLEIRKPDQALLWKVSYNQEYGPPGPLAYKLDTLVINRRVEEAGHPVPKLIALGSLRQMAQQLGLGADTNRVKRALLQNATPFITARITYQARDRTQRTLEAAFSRYSVLFTGERLPDGRKAHAVYLLLNDIYREVLQQALTRPLDYDYLATLAPLAQRFYEIVSYQVYAAVKTQQRAKLAYSEFCLYSTMRRHFDYDRVKKQMYRIHRPHLLSRYLAKVEFQTASDEEGRPDWLMFYTPGEKAWRDQRALDLLGSRNRPALSFAPPCPAPSSRKTRPPRKATPLPTKQEAPASALAAAGLVQCFYDTFFPGGPAGRPTSKELNQAQDLRDRLGEERARALIAYAHREAPQSRYRPRTFGGILHYERTAGAELAKLERHQARTRARQAREQHEAAYAGAYQDFLRALFQGTLKTTFPEASEAFQNAEERLRAFHQERAARSSRSAAFVNDFADEEARFQRFRAFFKEHPDGGVPSFWDWDARHNPHRFDRRLTTESPETPETTPT